MTPGYVGADFLALVSEAGARSVERIFGHLKPPATSDNGDAGTPIQPDEPSPPPAPAPSDEPGCSVGDTLRVLRRPLNAAELAPLYVTMDDFIAAMRKVQPSAKREGFATVPNVSWADVGALAPVRIACGWHGPALK